MGALPRPDVPPGPVRTLFTALHDLHHRAGWPSLRDMSRDVGASHTTISGAFTGPRVPRWGLLELLVETLGGAPEEFHRLWLDATGSRPESTAPDPPVRASAEPTPSGPPLPHQLPADVVGFTGRDDQLADLDRLLATDAASIRLGVVCGTAGVGKTALAVRWAHRVAARFPAGQLYVDLRGYDPDSPLRPDEVLESFLRALGVDGASLPMASAERAARWRSAVAGRPLLVLLDNANSVEQVRDLLPGDPAALVVVTSRDALPGLVARHGARRVDVDLLRAADALALLRTLVGDRVDAAPSAAQALVRRAARLPLALRIVAELALSRPDDSLADLVREFDERSEPLDLLSAGEDRYTAVHAVFSWSHQQLGDTERRAFALLGLHPGADIDEQAAAALFGVQLRDARRTLGVLARAHLVEQRRGLRFAMHDLLRAYSAELSDDLDELDRIRSVTRLFDHYLTQATSVDRTAVGYAWLDAERANLLAVAIAAREVWPGHTVGIAVALARYLDSCAYYSDALALDELALSTARAGGDAWGEATALNLLGSVQHRLERYPQAHRLHEQALGIHRDLGDRSGEAGALQGLGILALREGRYAESVDTLERARDMFRELGDPAGEGRVLYVLGGTLCKLARYTDAYDELVRAVEINARAGERANEGRAYNNLGEVLRRLDREDDAVEAYTASLAIARELGNRLGEGVALMNLGMVEHDRRSEDAALAYYESSLAVCRDVGYRIGEAEAECGLAAVLRSLQRHDEAIAMATDAVEITRTIGEVSSETIALAELAAALGVAGRRGESAATYRSMLALAQTSGDLYELARAHDGLAEFDDPEQTDGHRRRAADVRARLGVATRAD